MSQALPATVRCLVVANPAAGGASPQLLERVTAECARHARLAGVVWTRRPGHATRLVREVLAGAAPGGRVDVVVAVGGDGTIREVAEGFATAARTRAAGTDPADGPALLILPAGTGNSGHRSLWADRPWPDVLRACLAERRVRVRHIDMAWLAEAERPVLLGASSGLIATVTELAQRHSTVVGRERYHIALAEAWRDFRPYPGRVLVDGSLVHEGATATATVGGARHRVGTFEVLPNSILDDGLLDVCVLDGDGDDAQRSELALHVMSGTHVGREGVTYRRGKRIVIERTDGGTLSFEYDGEVWSGRRTATLDVMAGALPILAPPDPVAG